LFRRLFHQSVAGLLSCSLSLTASSQLKPFVFCIADCSPVGRRTVVFLLCRRLFTGRSPDCCLSFVISSNAWGTLNGPVVVVACLQTRHSSSSLVHSLTHFFIDGVAVSLLFVNRHSLQPCRSSSLATRIDPVDPDCFVNSNHLVWHSLQPCRSSLQPDLLALLT